MRAGTGAEPRSISDLPDAVLERSLRLLLFGGALQAPELPMGLVPRPELLARLRNPRDAAVVVVVAPAGYGKTTLLGQWADEDERPFAWVSVSRRHNDATVLLAYLSLALDALDPLDERELVGLSRSGADLTSLLLPRLREALGAVSQPFVLVIDDLHRLTNEEPISVLAAVAEHMPRGSQLVLASRTDPPFSLARTRASRRLLHLRTEDLAMTPAQGVALLREEGVELSQTVGDGLVSQTEGWPAGLYLAALALREQPDPEAAARAFGGDDPLIAGYLREEVLPVPPEELDFLVATSILERLCGPLCDAVIDGPGSVDTLERLRRSNRFVVGLDRQGEWFRYHHLFQDMLQRELRRREPGREAVLHGRASRWLERDGDVDGAVRHARAAGDIVRVAALVWSNAPRFLVHGRTTTVANWLDSLGEEEIHAHAALALTRAWWCLHAGPNEGIEHWLTVAESGRSDETLPDGTPLRSAILLLRAVVGTGGLSSVQADAALAFDLGRPGSAWCAIARFLEGGALRLLGENELACRRLEEGSHLARENVPATQVQCLGQLALLAIEDGAWSQADALLDEARRLIDQYALVERPPMVAVYAAAALSLARRGETERAKADFKHALLLLERIRMVGPWFVAETMLLLARASQLLGDVATARMLVREAESELAGYTDCGTLPQQLERIGQMTAAAAVPVGIMATPLTPAEMRVLRYLPTHLDFGAIAKELFVSRSTVKTQATAVYRKLGVSSRAHAVEQAKDLGLLEQS